jgi:hypothetical protein
MLHVWAIFAAQWSTRPGGSTPEADCPGHGAGEGVVVRGSSVASLDSGTESLDYGEKPPAVPARAGLAQKPLDEAPSAANGTAATPPPSTPAFPVFLGSAYTLQFGQVCLSSSPDNALERANQLATYIPANAGTLQSEFDWNGAGTLTLESQQVAGIDAPDAHRAVVTLPATLNGRLMEFGVPLYASGDRIVMSGESRLPAFFQAYASGDQATLNRFPAAGASAGGLGGAVSFGSIAGLTVPHGGATRDITVTVDWLLPDQVNQDAPQLAATCDMSVVDQRSGRWYVRDIRASTQPMGTQ